VSIHLRYELQAALRELKSLASIFKKRVVSEDESSTLVLGILCFISGIIDWAMIRVWLLESKTKSKLAEIITRSIF
jgi:hypothetical protein